MKNFLSRTSFLLIVLCSFGIFMAGKQAAMNLEVLVLITTVASLIIAIAMERYLPFRKSWNVSADEIGTDLTSATVLLGAVDPLLKYAAPLLVVYFYSLLPILGLTQYAWSQAPFLLQLVAATLLIELGEYWSHRMHHQHKKLWWLHAMHHSSERLYAMNNFRFHPLNYFFNFSLGIFPAMLLGVPPEVLLAYLSISQPVLMLQHANINLRSGCLNTIFSTNELHRWHHSTADTEANNNYGHAFVFWDQVFGTYRHEREKTSPKKVGLFYTSHRYPGKQGYFSQLRSAFTPNCCSA
jgi:ornithine lipid hydroxylase